MRALRIIFMGTPEFSVPMLEAIHKSDYELVGVVTAEDKPAGRGRKLKKSAVKVYAESQNIPILQPKNLKSEDFLKDLKALNPNCFVVVAFRMLPKQVWDLPEYGTFNLHASLLPQYRGAAPINWAIINGETETGLTTFFIDEKIDTGQIIDHVSLPIQETDNVEDVYTKMLPRGVDLVMSTLDKIADNSLQTIPQNQVEELKPAPKLTKDNTRINWNETAKDIYNLVRGLSPYPLAWSILSHGNEEINCKISKVQYSVEDHRYNIGHVIQKNNSFYVAVKNGIIEILELKLSGKRLMKTKELLNGFEINQPAKMI